MKVFLCLSALHFVTFLGLLFVALDFSAVDGHEPGLASRIARPLVEVLGQPAFAVAGLLGPSGHVNAVEWTLLLLNSLLWGVISWWLFSVLRPRKA